MGSDLSSGISTGLSAGMQASDGDMRIEILIHSYLLERLLEPECLLGFPALKLYLSSLYLIWAPNLQA